jgi:tRNA-5-methyluridine54 2-sulfurtransferase
MRCRKCGQKAAIHMPEHRLALCKTHYLEWLPAQVERWIEHYAMFGHGDRLLVAVSGGKDSLSLWDMLYRLGYHPDGLYIDLGIQSGTNYSQQSLDCASRFAQTRGLNLRVVEAASDQRGEKFSNLLSKNIGEQPCSLCGMAKRHIMNAAALEGSYAALVTGHNLDDEAAVLFGNTLTWSTQQLARQAPVLPAANGFARKVKPLCRIAERETAAYALLSGIDYVYDECPHAVGNLTNFYKTLLNQLESQSPGAKLGFYLEFLRARSEGAFEQFSKVESLHECEVCGQPTTAPGRCAFCRMWEIEKLPSAVVGE